MTSIQDSCVICQTKPTLDDFVRINYRDLESHVICVGCVDRYIATESQCLYCDRAVSAKAISYMIEVIATSDPTKRIRDFPVKCSYYAHRSPIEFVCTVCSSMLYYEGSKTHLPTAILRYDYLDTDQVTIKKSGFENRCQHCLTIPKYQHQPICRMCKLSTNVLFEKTYQTTLHNIPVTIYHPICTECDKNWARFTIQLR